MILLGNKSDLADERKVEYCRGQLLADEYKVPAPLHSRMPRHHQVNREKGVIKQRVAGLRGM